MNSIDVFSEGHLSCVLLGMPTTMPFDVFELMDERDVLDATLFPMSPEEAYEMEAMEAFVEEQAAYDEMEHHQQLHWRLEDALFANAVPTTPSSPLLLPTLRKLPRQERSKKIFSKRSGPTKGKPGLKRCGLVKQPSRA